MSAPAIPILATDEEQSLVICLLTSHEADLLETFQHAADAGQPDGIAAYLDEQLKLTRELRIRLQMLQHSTFLCRHAEGAKLNPEVYVGAPAARGGRR